MELGRVGRFLWKAVRAALFGAVSTVVPKDLITLIVSGKHDKYSNITRLARLMGKDGRVRIIRDCPDSWKEGLLNLFTLARSAVMAVDASTPYVSQLPLSAKTRVVFIGHGGGCYKKMAFSAMDEEDTSRERRRIQRVSGRYDFCICTSEHIKKYVALNYNIDVSCVIPLGLPRIDSLYDVCVEKYKAEFLSRYRIAVGKKLMLYSPTFRTRDGVRYSPNYLKEAALPEDFCVLYRSHPTAKQANMPGGWIDVSAMPQDEVLAISDILVSDYSSIIFDFAFFGRPIFLLAPDWQEYQKNERKLWFSPQELMHDQFCPDVRTLCERLSSATVSDLWDRHMSACDGRSCEKIANFLFNLAGDKR